MNKLILTPDEARRIVYDDHKDWKVVEEVMIGTSRWSIEKETIAKHLLTDKYYRFCYQVGATEMQYESPYEYDKEAEAVEVVSKEVTVVQWVTKET